MQPAPLETNFFYQAAYLNRIQAPGGAVADRNMNSCLHLAARLKFLNKLAVEAKALSSQGSEEVLEMGKHTELPQNHKKVFLLCRHEWTCLPRSLYNHDGEQVAHVSVFLLFPAPSSVRLTEVSGGRPNKKKHGLELCYHTKP